MWLLKDPMWYDVGILNTKKEGETVSTKDSKLLIRSLIMSDAIFSRLIRLILALLNLVS